MRLRLDLGYDGTNFHGWAAQPGLRTVQSELETALKLLLRNEQARLTVGGRTDAGVHARGQVAHLDVDDELASRVTAHRLNGALKRSAPDVVVHTVSHVSHEFDARFSALSRRYEYRVRDTSSRRDPLFAHFTAEVGAELNLALMQRVSAELLGLHDFTTFCKAREGATAVRELLQFDWRTTDDGAFAATVAADAFCHSMVRSLVGAVVAVGSAKIRFDDVLRLRDARERTSRFAVMPAHGLSLEEIVYPPAELLAARANQTRARRDPMGVLD